MRLVLNRRFLPAVTLAICAAKPAAAQQSERGSRLIESGHWAYEYLTRLRSRGYLTGLDPMARPYRQADIAAALSHLDPDTLPEPVRGWVRLLRSEFQAPNQPWGAMVLGGTRAANSDRLDPLRPWGDGGAWPSLAAGAWVEAGHLAAETRVLGDLYLSHDPELKAPYRPLGGQVDHSYLSVAVPHAAVTLGRVSRDWGPAGTPGLLLSDGPLPYPQLGFEGVFGRFGFQAFTAELDTLAGAKRYLAAQRLAYTTGNFAIAAADAILYGGPDVAPSLELLNPLAPLAFERDNPPSNDRNQDLMLSLEAWYRLRGLVLDGQFLLDDVDVDPPAGSDPAPTRYALTAGARVTGLAPWLELAARYIQVSSFAYRSFVPGDRYDYLGRGLGANFADHDQLTLGADLFPPLPGLTLTPTFQLLRQGDGDFRVAMPDMTTFRASPNLLLGTVERTYRVGLRGSYQPLRYVWVRWDVGHNTVRNAGHVAGSTRSDFVALGELGLRLEFGPRTR